MYGGITVCFRVDLTSLPRACALCVAVLRSRPRTRTSPCQQSCESVPRRCTFFAVKGRENCGCGNPLHVFGTFSRMRSPIGSSTRLSNSIGDA